MNTSPPAGRRAVAALIVGLLGAAAWCRLNDLSSVPGISGDEGWWGMQALAWLSGRPYEARTTSGNPIDPFFLVPVALLHAVAPPSFLLLRLVPALVNLAALPMAFVCVRRLYGSTVAWVHTVALAILPTAIAHSRICQDPSQSVFWSGLVVYLGLLGLEASRRAWIWLGAALLAFLVAAWTHPTNVFVAPFLALPVAAATRRWWPASRRARLRLAAAAALLTTLGAVASLLALAQAAGRYPSLDKPWLAVGLARLIDGRQWVEFAANNARLLNGVTVYHYFSGARPWPVPYDAAFLVVFAAASWGFLLPVHDRRRLVDYGLIAACSMVWLLFYAFAGPVALRPHFERWALCLLVPATLVIARGLGAWIECRPGKRGLATGAAALLATGVLVSFYVNYFREFATTGGRSHLTYVTAATEPKRQALERILADSPGQGRVVIVARQWWLFWPITYLASGHAHVYVRKGLEAGYRPELDAALDEGRVFFVEFADTPELAAATDWIRERHLRAERTRIADAGGRTLLVILRVRSQPS